MQQRIKKGRRPAVISMLHTVARLEAIRDKLNPTLVPLRNADQNLDALRAWRATSGTLRAALPVKTELPSPFKAPELYTATEAVMVRALRGGK